MCGKILQKLGGAVKRNGLSLSLIKNSKEEGCQFWQPFLFVPKIKENIINYGSY